MDANLKKKLDDVFYNQNFLMKSLPKFIHKLNSLNINLPPKLVKFYYNNQAITQIFRPPNFEKQTKYNPILSFKPFERVYMDTMYLIYPKQTLAIVNLYDMFSKYGDGRIIPISSGAKNISSEKAREAFSEMLDTIRGLGYEVNSVYTDNGNEYSKYFDNYLTEQHIIHIYGNIDDKRMTSPIERFNKTLRLSMEKYKMTYGRISKNVLPIIIDAYNNSVHTIGYSPMQILKDPKIQEKVEAQNTDYRKSIKKTKILTGYVRILLNKDLFAKTGANWSSEIYKIKKYNLFNNRYVLDGVEGEFSRDELQPIDKNNLMKPNIKVVEEVQVEKPTQEVSETGRPVREKKPNKKYM